MSEEMIRAEGLSKYYGQFTAVEQISFSIPRGQVAAFLGPNGAGKSTTMKLLTGFLAPSAGASRIAGHAMQNDRIAGASRLGYLPENGPLYLDMTPLESLRFAADIRGLDKVQEAIDRVVDSCHLEEVLHKPCGKLSKGFRQRVGMAQALLHDPEVLILDEPTSGLDPNQIRSVRELIARLAKTKTILLSTHILQEVEAMASRVLLVNAGRLVFDGSVQELKAKGPNLDEVFHQLTAAKA